MRISARTRKGISAGASALLVLIIFWYVLPQIADISDVWTSIRNMTWLEVATLSLAAAWNLATYSFVTLTSMPGLTFPQAFVVTESSTAVSNTMPAGSALGIGLTYAMYGSWGFSRSRSTVSVLLCGLWNNFAKLGLPVFALAALALYGTPSAGRIALGLAGVGVLVAAVVVLALTLRSEAMANRVGVAAASVASAILRPFRRGPVSGWELATVKFRARTIRLLRARWHWLTLATLVSHLSLFLVLLIALRHVGVSQEDVAWPEALAVFAFARLLTAIPITPGGVGIVELALIAGLSAAGGARAPVTAAVLLFRGLSYVLPILIGVVTYLFWRRNTSWRRPPGGAPRTPLVTETV